MSGKTIRVMIVDDHSIVRSGLSAVLGVYPDLELVGEAKNGAVAVAMCGKVQPDVVLMDLVMPVMGGIEAIQVIHKQHPQVEVLALTSFQEEKMVQDAIQAGAIGYILKDIDAPDLANAIRMAAEGKPTLAPEAAQVLMQSAIGSPRQIGDDLTSREREILRLMTKGMSNPEIAERLVISPGTVKFHVSKILAKLGAASRTEAAALALQHNLVN